MERRFQPTKVSTISMLVMLIILLGLGSWQVKRMGWKDAIISRMEINMAADPKPLPEDIEIAEEWDFRQASAIGSFLYDKEILLGPRHFKSQVGYHMIVPFQRVSGEVVLVNRGWISELKLPEAYKPEGVFKISGLTHVPDGKGSYTPDNKPKDGQWFWVDFETIKTHFNFVKLSPVVLYEDNAKVEDQFPVGGQLRMDIPNDHFQYSLFWFFMAFVLLIVYFMYCWRPVEDKKEND